MRIPQIAPILLLVVSCGATDQPTPGPNVDDNANADTGQSCAGCTLAGTGECVNGDSAAACGLGGVECQSCATGFCSEAGQCVEPPDCGPTNCTGCCDPSGLCIAGTAQNACGRAGLACENCGTNATCQNSACVLNCGPDTCAGCCGPDGVCVPGDADALCGRGGGLCSDCASISSVCSDGFCVAPDCAASCNGCCSGSDCVVVPNANQCGTGGAACASCGDGRNCNDGGCAVDPNGEWTLSVETGVVVNTDVDGDSWDGFNGLPDPFVEATVGATTASSAPATDALAPAWNEPLLTTTASEFLGGISFRYMDSDVALDDTICEVTVTLTPEHPAFDGGVVETPCPNQPASFFRWRLLF